MNLELAQYFPFNDFFSFSFKETIILINIYCSESYISVNSYSDLSINTVIANI